MFRSAISDGNVIKNIREGEVIENFWKMFNENVLKMKPLKTSRVKKTSNQVF